MLFEIFDSPDLASYDVILINTSGGKDSMAAMIETVRLADEAGVRDRLVAVHADLGRVEWDGVADLAREHAEHFGIRFEIVSKPGSDLLERIRERGKFPDPARRWCTSDFKRGPIRKLMTALANELHGNERSSKGNPSKVGRPVRILNALGIRAAESPAREKLGPFDFEHGNSRRHVDRWHPVYRWSESRVWEEIRASGLRWHSAYDEGMPRLSCKFCIFASRDALLIAGEHDRKLLDEYVAVETEIGHDFTLNLPIVEIRNALDRGERGDPNACRSCPWAA